MPQLSTPSGQSQIALHVNRAISLFKSLIVTLEDNAALRSSATSHFARFKLWAGSLGAHRLSGTRSLEYRLRDASFIRSHLLSLLVDLCHSLDEAVSSVNNKPPTASHDDTTLDELEEYFQSDHESEDGKEAVLKDIAHVIDCLLRLSVTIRHPAPHDQFKSRAGIGVLEYYKKWDIQHAETKFPKLDPVLHERLAVANGRRRQYFKYRAEHVARFEEGLDVDDSTAKSAGLNEMATTVASSLPDHLKESSSKPIEQREDAMSEASGTSYATSAAESLSTKSTHLRVPPIPVGYEDGPLRCPFCQMFILLNSRSDWKRHVFGDLQPYVCLESDCSTPDHLYSRRSLWIKHMKAEHWREWHCPFGCSAKLKSQIALRSHIQAHHRSQVSDANLQSLVNLSSRDGGVKGRGICPLCSDFECSSNHQYERHVGQHMEDLALFVLPVTSQDDEGSEHDDSDDDQGTHDEEIEPSGGLSKPAAETVWNGTVTFFPLELRATAKYVGGVKLVDPLSRFLPPHLDLSTGIVESENWMLTLSEQIRTDATIISISPVHEGDRDLFDGMVNQVYQNNPYPISRFVRGVKFQQIRLVALPSGTNHMPPYFADLVNLPHKTKKSRIFGVFFINDGTKPAETRKQLQSESEGSTLTPTATAAHGTSDASTLQPKRNDGHDGVESDDFHSSEPSHSVAEPNDLGEIPSTKVDNDKALADQNTPLIEQEQGQETGDDVLVNYMANGCDPDITHTASLQAEKAERIKQVADEAKQQDEADTVTKIEEETKATASEFKLNETEARKQREEDARARAEEAARLRVEETLRREAEAKAEAEKKAAEEGERITTELEQLFHDRAADRALELADTEKKAIEQEAQVAETRAERDARTRKEAEKSFQRRIEDLLKAPDPEKLRLEAELAAFKAKADPIQAERDTRIRKEAEERFQRRMADLRKKQEDAKIEIEKAKAEAERAARERIETERKAPDPEKLRLEAELAAFKAKEEEAKAARIQAEREAQIRQEAEEAFLRKLEDLRKRQEDAKIEVKRAKAEAERTARERIEAERKAEEEQAREHGEAMQRAEEKARQKFKAELKEAEAKAKAEKKAAEEAEIMKQIAEEAKRKAEAEAAAKIEEENKKAQEAAEAEKQAKVDAEELKKIETDAREKYEADKARQKFEAESNEAEARR